MKSKQSTKSNFLSHDEIGDLREAGKKLNPIDQFLWDYSPVDDEQLFREQLFEAVNFEEPDAVL